MERAENNIGGCLCATIVIFIIFIILLLSKYTEKCIYSNYFLVFVVSSVTISIVDFFVNEEFFKNVALNGIIAEKSEEITNLREEISVLESNLIEKSTEIKNLLANIEGTEVYKTLNTNYEEAVTDLIEAKTERDRYFKRMQSLELENERIVTIALQEGLEIPISSSDDS